VHSSSLGSPIDSTPVRVGQLDSLQRDRLERRFTASFLAEGTTQKDAQVRVLPEPIVIEAEEWFQLRQAVVQRMRLLTLLTNDIRSITLSQGGRLGKRIDDRIVDAVLSGSDVTQLLQPTSNLAAPSIVIYGVDIIRNNPTTTVLRDLLDHPTGLGAALLVRSIVGRQFADEIASLSVTPYLDYLTHIREALADLAPRGRRLPRTVVLAPTSGEPGHVESAFLATRLGHHLASPADLVVLKNRVWLRTLSGTEPVDIVLRATPGRVSDPLADLTTTITGRGVAALSLAWRHEGVGLANPLGLDCIEQLGCDRATAGYLDETLEAIQSTMGPPTRIRLKSDVRSTEQLASAATEVIRLHAVAHGDEIHVFPGGIATTMVGGVAHLKDVWVRTGTPARPRPDRRLDLSADLVDSVPTSAAEGLFLAGRHAEQAEVAARMLRMIVRHAFNAEPNVLGRFVAMASAVTDRSFTHADEPDLGIAQRVDAATDTLWSSGPGSVLRAVTALNVNLQTARPFVSASTWSVLVDLNETIGLVAQDDDPTRLTPTGILPSDTFDYLENADRILGSLAALAGLIEESTVRSPARTFLLIGRRLQRMHRLIAALGIALDANTAGAHDTTPGVFEGLLNAFESLITYRRRFGSDMQTEPLLRLLVHDTSNPRGLSFQAARLVKLIDDLPTNAAHEPHQRQVTGLRERTGDVVAWRRDPLSALAEVDAMTRALIESVVDEWFSVDRVRGAGLIGSALWGA
jgi:uncharacterized alpha-E superfamily protein